MKDSDDIGDDEMMGADSILEVEKGGASSALVPFVGDQVTLVKVFVSVSLIQEMSLVVIDEDFQTIRGGKNWRRRRLAKNAGKWQSRFEVGHPKSSTRASSKQSQ